MLATWWWIMVPLNEAFIQSLDKYVLNVYRLPARLDPGDTAVNKANVRLTWAELSLWSKEDTSLITCRSAERGLFYEHMSCCSVKTLKQYMRICWRRKDMATHSSTLAWKIPWRGAWRATIHRAAKSRTLLERLHTHTPTRMCTIEWRFKETKINTQSKRARTWGKQEARHINYNPAVKGDPRACFFLPYQSN